MARCRLANQYRVRSPIGNPRRRRDLPVRGQHARAREALRIISPELPDALKSPGSPVNGPSPEYGAVTMRFEHGTRKTGAAAKAGVRGFYSIA